MEFLYKWIKILQILQFKILQILNSVFFLSHHMPPELMHVPPKFIGMDEW